VDLGATGHVVLRSIDMAAGVERRYARPHDLARATGCVVLLENSISILHVFLNPAGVRIA